MPPFLSEEQRFRDDGDDQSLQRRGAEVDVVPLLQGNAVDADEGSFALERLPEEKPQCFRAVGAENDDEGLARRERCVCPLGEGGGEGFEFTLTVEDGREYFLYTVCEEIYGGYTVNVELSFISPPERYFSVTESGEFLGLSEAEDYSASPGESGVLRLELSFMSGGVAEISAVPRSGTEYLMGWVSLSPYLDGYTGAPAQNIVRSAAGGSEAPGLSIKFPLRGLSSYYLFIRGKGLYDAADFDVSLRQSRAAVAICTQGKFVRAQPCLYSEGQWHAAQPMHHEDDSWRG